MGFTSDLNEDIMTFKFNVMLVSILNIFRLVDWLRNNFSLIWFISHLQGQAQECVLEKSIIDNRKHTINAKVSAQIIDYYKIALANCEKSEFQSNLGSKQTKVSLHLSLSFLRNSVLMIVILSNNIILHFLGAQELLFVQNQLLYGTGQLFYGFVVGRTK